MWKAWPQSYRMVYKGANSIAKTKVITNHSRPWITPEIKSMLDNLHKLRNKAKCHRSVKNIEEFNEQVEIVSAKLEEAQILYIIKECEKLETMDDNQKWRAISKLLNHDNLSTVQPIKKGSSYLFEDEEILAEMEAYHVDKPSIITQDSDDIAEVNSWLEEAKSSKMKNIMDSPITKFEVESTFGTCSDTPGSDGFKAKLIDNAEREIMTKCLLKLWQEAWCQGVFLKDWKREHRAVLPKPNKESYNQCNSYRTVSLTAILGKRYEKISSTRLKTFLDSVNFDSKQHAYMNGRSSTHALLKLTQKIKSAILKGKVAGVVFYDFTDAFGNVNRQKLIKKLWKKYKIRGKLFLHLHDFLTDRTARIRVNNLTGEWKVSNWGTSAGTVLGAILFLLQVADSPECVDPKYADDFTTIVIGDTVIEVETKLQNHINELVPWAKENDMLTKQPKTKAMLNRNRSFHT